MKKIGKPVLILFAVLGVVLVLFFSVLFLYFLPKAQIVRNSSSSMGASCPLGSRVVVDKEFYKNIGLKRGDVVVFKRIGEEDYIVKRIIGLTGEDIEMTKDGLFVNNNLLEEQYLINHSLPKDNFVKLVFVPPEIENQKMYYLLGDNESRSTTGTEYPDDIVSQNQIVGYVASCRVTFRL